MSRMNPLLAFTFSLFLASCGQDKTPDTPNEPSFVPVHIIMPIHQDVPIQVETIGVLLPSVSLDISPQVQGTLQEILVKEGHFIKAGTPLFKIEDEPYRLHVKETEAQLEIDKSILLAARKKWERICQLNDPEIVAKSEWDRHELEVAKASGQVALDQARMSQALLDLKRCTISAPIEGRIGKINAARGMQLSKSTPLSTLCTLDPLLVEFSLTEKEFGLIQKETGNLLITPLCNECLSFNGTVTFIDNHFNPETGQILLRAQIKNTDHLLRPGQIVRLEIPVNIHKNALLVPEKTVKHNRQGPYVYVVNDSQTVELRHVITGQSSMQNVMILEGLSINDKVVLEGHLRLQPGIKVEIL